MQQPGTVSKILWHFTGVPKWSPSKQKQNIKLKPENVAYDILIKILSSKILKVGNFKEVVHWSRRKQYKLTKKGFKLKKNVPSTI